MSKQISQFLTYGIIAILAIIVLVFDPWFTPIGFGKTLIFRSLISVLTLVFLWQILIREIKLSHIVEKIKSVSLSFWLLIATLFLFSLSTVFSLDRYQSLWGDPARCGGLINFAFYFLLAVFTFLSIKKSGWTKILNFSIITGIIVCVVALIQQFGLFSKYFISFNYRPVSLLGNTMFVAVYLLLLSFVAFSCTKSTKNIYLKIYYYFCIFTFVSSIVFLTQTRSAIVGLILSSLWLFFGYPFKKSKLKIYFGMGLTVLLLFAFGLKVYMDNHIGLYGKHPGIIATGIDRTLSVFEGSKMIGSRVSAWQLSLEALKDRPLLGYGPDNFKIAFDKHYDPSLPYLSPNGGEGEVQWWDRAHNLIFDISVTAGIPALLVYLAFFASIIWLLESAKKRKPENIISATCVQSAIIGYLISMLFTFDAYDTSIILFLLIGYGLFLISESAPIALDDKKASRINKIEGWLFKNKKSLGVIALVITIGFIYSFNWVAMLKNKNFNDAIILSSRKNGCAKAVGIITEIAKQSPGITYNYFAANSADILQKCSVLESTQKAKLTILEQSKAILEKSIKKSPNQLSGWLLAAETTNMVIEIKNEINKDTGSSEDLTKLKSDANLYFQKSSELSPKRVEVYKEWLKLGINTRDYNFAREKATECLNIYSKFGACDWFMVLISGYLGDNAQVEFYTNEANKNGYNTNSEEALKQLANMQMEINDYKNLATTYEKMIAQKENIQEKAQLLASLAAVYNDLGNTKKARETALKILDIMPEAKAMVDEFLKTLK